MTLTSEADFVELSRPIAPPSLTAGKIATYIATLNPVQTQVSKDRTVGTLGNPQLNIQCETKWWILVEDSSGTSGFSQVQMNPIVIANGTGWGHPVPGLCTAWARARWRDDARMPLDLSGAELATAAQACRAMAHQEGERAKAMENPGMRQPIENTARRFASLAEKLEAARKRP
jgi:hypothetical protein